MATKIRLTRIGAKKRPFYRIIVTNSRNARDGAYIERLGTYNPLLARDDENRVVLNQERAKYWLGTGAQPTDRVARILSAAGLMERKERRSQEKAKPKAKAQQRLKEAAEAAEAAAAAAADEAKAGEPAEAESGEAPATA